MRYHRHAGTKQSEGLQCASLARLVSRSPCRPNDQGWMEVSVSVDANVTRVFDVTGFVLFGAISVDSAGGCCPGPRQSLISPSSEHGTGSDDNQRFTTGASVIGGVAGNWAFSLPAGLRNASILVLSACVASRASYSSAMAFPIAFTR